MIVISNSNSWLVLDTVKILVRPLSSAVSLNAIVTALYMPLPNPLPLVSIIFNSFILGNNVGHQNFIELIEEISLKIKRRVFSVLTTLTNAFHSSGLIQRRFRYIYFEKSLLRFEDFYPIVFSSRFS